MDKLPVWEDYMQHFTHTGLECGGTICNTSHTQDSMDKLPVWGTIYAISTHTTWPCSVGIDKGTRGYVPPLPHFLGQGHLMVSFFTSKKGTKVIYLYGICKGLKKYFTLQHIFSPLPPPPPPLPISYLPLPWIYLQQFTCTYAQDSMDKLPTCMNGIHVVTICNFKCQYMHAHLHQSVYACTSVYPNVPMDWL